MIRLVAAILPLFLVLCGPENAFAATSYQVNNGATVTIDEHGVCKIVTNNHASGLALFVPTNTASEWTTFRSNPPTGVTIGNDTCCGTPAVGTLCADGSVYAGLSPDGNVAMYTTAADASSGTPWNNGNSSGYVTTSQTSAVTGEANTANLITIDSNSGVGGTQPHQAAQLCADSTANGHSDWYLPAKNELNVLYTSKTAIGGFNVSGSFPAGYYWSSSEYSNFFAWNQRFSDGNQFNSTKNGGSSVRCVRR